MTMHSSIGFYFFEQASLALHTKVGWCRPCYIRILQNIWLFLMFYYRRQGPSRHAQGRLLSKFPVV